MPNERNLHRSLPFVLLATLQARLYSQKRFKQSVKERFFEFLMLRLERLLLPDVPLISNNTN